MLALQLRLRGDADLWTQVAGPARRVRAVRPGRAPLLARAARRRARARARPRLRGRLPRRRLRARRDAAALDRPAPLRVGRPRPGGRDQPVPLRARDPALAGLRDDGRVAARSTSPRWHTVYPPGAEASFLAARGVFGDGLRATTWLFLAAEAAAVAPTPARARRAAVAPAARAGRRSTPGIRSRSARSPANGHVDALAVSRARRRSSPRGRPAASRSPAPRSPRRARRSSGRSCSCPRSRGGAGRASSLVALGLCVLAYVPYLSVGTGVFGDLARLRRAPALRRAAPGGCSRHHLGKSGATAPARLSARRAARDRRAARARRRRAGRPLGLLVLGGLLLDRLVRAALACALAAAVLRDHGRSGLDSGWPARCRSSTSSASTASCPTGCGSAVYGPLAALGALARSSVARRRGAGRRSTPLARPARRRGDPGAERGGGASRRPARVPGGVVDEVIVVDGGSDDGTPAARAGGGRAGRGRGAPRLRARLRAGGGGDRRGRDRLPRRRRQRRPGRRSPALLGPVLDGRAALVARRAAAARAGRAAAAPAPRQPARRAPRPRRLRRSPPRRPADARDPPRRARAARRCGR